MSEYLQPTSALPVNDRPLEDIFGDMVAGISGMDRNSVRPRIQPTPPNLPPQEEDWVALGVTPIDQDTFAYERPLPALTTGGIGGRVERDEMLEVSLSFYGANSNRNMATLREGLAIEQNRRLLWLQGIKLVGLGKPVSLPSLLKNRYVRRIDLALQFSRRMIVEYAVPTMTHAIGELHTEQLPPISINSPNE